MALLKSYKNDQELIYDMSSLLTEGGHSNLLDRMPYHFSLL